MSDHPLHLNASQSQDLETHVDAVSLGLQALALLLVRERQALTERGGADVLEAISMDKQEAVANVASLYGLLRDALETLTEAGGDFSDHVSDLKQHHPQLARRVDQLVELTRECQLANQENGTLVNARLRGTRGLLDLLQDASAGPAPLETYGPPGAGLGAITGSRLSAQA